MSMDLKLFIIFFVIAFLSIQVIKLAFGAEIQGTVSAEIVSIETWCSTQPSHNACVELFNEGYITYSSNGNATWNAP